MIFISLIPIKAGTFQSFGRIPPAEIIFMNLLEKKF